MNSAEEFLATGDKFRLGHLETEKPHPATRELSMLANENLSKALTILAQVDSHALDKVGQSLDRITDLHKAVQNVWQKGHKVFLCGCGATGRLSLAIEYLYREQTKADNVRAFMAGGDVALVHSLEGFEDFPEYGARHLRELGFRAGDLLIASTEGGETPYVIGATEEAARLSEQNPYFLYCNPDQVLTVERSRRVLENKRIEKINLTVGPMALAGSTRMQASTVLQLAVGLALLGSGDHAESELFLAALKSYLATEPCEFLPGFIERESAEYKADRYVMYWVRNYPITVFTDTTERAPTFSLTPFSHPKAERLLKLKPSLCYIGLPDSKNADDAWRAMLLREPHALNWPDIDPRTGSDYLHAFDFSQKAAEFRAWLTKDAEHSDFEIERRNNLLRWSFQDLERSLKLPDEEVAPNLRPLFEHTLLKMFLNMHSTLVMGRLGRYKRNLMTWVYPTNGKLIDRATRYAQTLLHEDGIEVPYEDVVRALFEMKTKITANESIVLATYNHLKK